MKCIVDQWVGDVFVYDTKTGVCKMIRASELGVDLPRIDKQTASLTKLRMLYNLNDYGGYYVNNLVEYSIPVHHSHYMLDINVYLSIRVIPKEFLDNSQRNKFDEYLILLNVHTWDSSGWLSNYNDTIFSGFNIGFNFYEGIVIPIEMFSYIVQLYNNKDLESILDAFSGYLTWEMSFIAGNKLYKADKNCIASNIEWQ